MSNILIVDDEPEIAETLMDYLSSCGHTVSTCINAQDGLTALSAKNIQLVLSDIKMPKMDGVDFFKEYKSKNSTNVGSANARFVLMTGHADLMNVEKAYSIGVDELISKPFDLDVLKLVIDYLLESEDSYGASDEKYFAISIDEFMANSHNDYSLFLKINHKYMCVTKTGQEFTTQRLQNLILKGIKYIYLNSDDYAKYADLQFVTVDQTKQRPVDNAKKVKAYNQLTANISAHPLLGLVDNALINRAMGSVSNYAQAIFNHPELSEIYVPYTTDTPSLALKSSLIAVLSSSIAELWKWSSPRIQSRIVLGTLLCDIGLKSSPQLLNKKRIQYTPEDLKEYEAHPTRSHQILSQIEMIPSEILSIAIQHHENIIGQGFPNKLARAKIHSFSKLVQGVNEFVETLLIQNEKTPDQAASVELALNQVFSFQRKLISEQVLKSLYIIFNKPVPKDLEGLLLPDQTNRVL